MKAVSDMIESLLSVNVSVMKISPKGLINLFINICNTGTRILREQAGDGHLSGSEEDGSKKLLSYESLREMTEYTIRFLDSVAEGFSGSRPKRGGKLKSDIEDYLNNHYKDPNMSLQTLSDHLGLSSSHVSRVFGSFFGVSLLSYINGIRIKHAMELLRDSRLSINGVAAGVGYVSIVTFRRCFKSVTGMNPQDYRDTLSSDSK